MEHWQFATYIEVQVAIGATYGGFNLLWRISTGEDEAEVARAFRERYKGVVDLCGDLDAGDQRDCPGFLYATDTL